MLASTSLRRVPFSFSFSFSQCLQQQHRAIHTGSALSTPAYVDAEHSSNSVEVAREAVFFGQRYFQLRITKSRSPEFAASPTYVQLMGRKHKVRKHKW